MSNKLAPSSQLLLDWVYGYRGHQCHNNLYYTKSDRIVYFVAGIGLVYDIKSHKQFYYFEHNDDIISLSLGPDGDLVATGQVGKAPYICVWSSSTMETKSILKDQHTHGISSVAFSKNGVHLVSIGLDPNATLNVWDWRKGKVLSTTRAHSDRVFDARFIPDDSNIRFVTCGVKHIKFWSLSGNTLSQKKGVYGQVGEIQTIFTACMSVSDSAICYSGTANGDIYIWRESTLERVIATVHNGSIYSIESCVSGYVSGGKDGCVVLFDPSFQPLQKIDLKTTSVGYPNLTVRSVHWMSNSVLIGTQDSDIIEVSVSAPNKPRSLMMGHAAGELWALAVHPKKSIFATGSDDCSLRLWQMIEKESLGVIRVDTKIRSCGFNNDGTLVAIGLMNGSFRVIRIRDNNEIHRAQDRKEVLHELKFSPDGRWLAVGSNDNFVDIYDVAGSYKRVGICKGNSSFITHLDWSVDSTYIRTNSGAAEYLVFKAPSGEHITQSQVLNTIKWANFTGVLGTDIQGIWAKYTDCNDINAADVNLSAQLIATGDDFGLVKIFNYPSPVKGAHFRKYTGHCAHVTNVRWSFDGKFLISIGGGDQSVFQWKLGDTSSSAGNASNQNDSFTEASDSALSDIGQCNSELEKEVQTDYQRLVSKEEVNQLQKVTKDDIEAGKKRKKAPSQGLQLEWVHGYRGYDCRNNLFYLKTGEIVFHVAAVGIVMDTITKVQRFYIAHNDDILCLALHPISDFIATGEVGREPTIHIWDASTMKVISIIKGEHERGVCAVDFSSDGKKLASIGLDDNHCLVIWDWRKGEKLASTRSHNDKIFVVKWDPHNKDQLVSVGMRFIRFWTQVGGGFTSKRGTFGTVAKLDTQLCAAYHPNQPGVCFTGTPSGLVYIWKDNILQSAVLMHTGGCYAIDALDKGFVTGGKDGTIKLCDETFTKVHKIYKINTENLLPNQMLSTACPTIRSVVLGKGKIVAGTSTGEIIELSTEGQVNVVVQGHGEGELWGLCIHPSKNICATVSDDGNLMVWFVEPQNHKLLNIKKLKGPARCCDISSDGSAVAVGFKDGSFSVFNLSKLDEIVSNHHRKEEISDIRFSPVPGKYLAVGSHDNFVDIYSVTSHQRLSVCKGCSSYITHIDWSADGKLLMVNSGAKEQLFFEAPRGTRQIIAKTEIEKVNWSSWTCVLGETCVGIWPPKCDITDINATSLNSDENILATGDDFGRVKLFEYPSKTKFAKFKQYLGHSAHVTNVRWLHNNDYLLTIGGADTALMVWKHRREPMTDAAYINSKMGQVQISDMSDADSEEENGYDSDVEREKMMDYVAKTYSERLSQQQTKALKPDLSSKVPPTNNLKSTVTRESAVTVKVQSAHSVAPEPVLENGSDLGKRSRAVHKSPVPPATPNTVTPIIKKVTKLELNYVHGYRGFDCRNNLHYLDADGSTIVYHAAAVGIVLHPESGKQSFFLEHNDDILCLAVNKHPKYKNVVATGQIGAIPAIHIWNASNTTNLSTIKGTHVNGICALDFSSTGTLLISVGIDNDHTIAIWKWETGTLLAKAKGHPLRIFLAEFRPDSDKLFVNVGVKHVKFWTLAGSELIAKRGVIPASFNQRMTTMLSVAFGTNDVTYTGAMNGSVWVWQSGILIRTVEKAHSGPVFVLFTTLIDGLIVSGGKEKGKDTGSVKLWDQEMNRNKPFHLAEDINVRGSSSTGGPLEDKSLEVIRSISRVKGKILLGTQDNDILEITEKTGTVKYLVQSHGEGLVCGLAVHPFIPQYASASEDGTVRIWDLHTKMLVQNLTTGPAISIHFSPNGAYIAIGLKSGAFVVLSAHSYRLLIRKKDRGKPIANLKFSPSSTVLVVASQDNAIDVYRITATGESPGTNKDPSSVSLDRTATCKDLASYAVQMDFSTDGEFLRCGLANYLVNVFAVSTGQVVTEPDRIARIIWSSWSSIAGDDVAGIWPEQSEKGDINTATVSHQNNVLVTGDDSGLVKLYGQFPVPRLNNSSMPPIGVYRGHSANVMKVGFVCDDSHLVSTGGEDCCVFVWKCS